MKAVIEIALGQKPSGTTGYASASAVRFIFGPEDVAVFHRLQKEYPEIIVQQDITETFDHEVVDSASRFGYFLMQSDDVELLQKYLPER